MTKPVIGTLPWVPTVYEVQTMSVNLPAAAVPTVLPPVRIQTLPQSTQSTVFPAVHLEERDGDIFTVPNVSKKQEFLPSATREGTYYKLQNGQLIGKGKKPGQEYPITDITLSAITHRTVYVDMDGVQHIRFLCIVESPKWDASKKIEVPEKELPQILQKVHEKYPETILFQRGADAISEMIANVYEACQESMETSYAYEQSGWQEEDGNIRYRIGSHSHYKNWEFPDVGCLDLAQRRRCFSAGFDFLEVGHGGKEVGMLFLYTHLAYTQFFFREAGHTVSFVLYVKGRTGSLKTSTALEVVAPFATDTTSRFIQIADSSFAGIREYLRLSQDSVALLDDFSKTQKLMSREGSVMLEKVHRAIGNGKLSEKKKPGGVGMQATAIRTLVIETGEDDPELGVSSFLRVLTLSVDRTTFDGRELKTFQHDRSIMRWYFALYIEFLQRNAESVVQTIQAGWEKYRQEYENVTTEPRLRETAMCLRIQVDLLVAFGNWCGADIRAMEEFRDRTVGHITVVVRENDTERKQIRADLLFIRAIWEQVTNGTKYQLADSGSEYHKNRQAAYIGFFDKENGYIWIKLEDALVAAQDYCSRHGVFLTSNALLIKKALHEHGLLDKPESGWVWRWTQGASRGRFVRLWLSRIKEIMKEVD